MLSAVLFFVLCSLFFSVLFLFLEAVSVYYVTLDVLELAVYTRLA